MHKRAPSPERRWGVTDAAAALLLTVLLLALAPNLRLPEPWSTLVGLLIIWVPLLGAVLLATFVRGSSSLARDFGFRITGLDILVGLFLGLALRTVVSIIEVIAYGRLPMEAATFGPVIYDGWWFFAAILAPVVIAPVVEELFFRGMLQRAVSASKLVAVLASSAIFALIHLASGYSWVATLSTFIVGFAFGSLAARTGRLGGPIIAHATFNGSLVALTLLP